MRITEMDVERFTAGDCHFLAKRINRVTGLPIHAFNVQAEEKPTLHAFNIYKGMALDVQGLQSMDDFTSKWGSKNISEPLSYEWFRDNWKPRQPSWGYYTYLRARQVANYLVHKYCIDFLDDSSKVSSRSQLVP